jgi:hypothetical protein
MEAMVSILAVAAVVLVLIQLCPAAVVEMHIQMAHFLE